MAGDIPEPVKEKLDEIADLIKQGRIAVFYGSGISVDPPSNLPTGGDLRFALFKEIFNLEQLIEIKKKILEDESYSQAKNILLSGYVERWDKTQKRYIKEKYYPFEAFVQTIHENTGVIDSLAALFRLGEPNMTHLYIAYLMEKGYIWEAMTTNFDENVEKAVQELITESLDLRYGSLDVRFRERDFNRWVLPFLQKPFLYKIHGTCSDKESMRTTINTISSSLLSPVRERKIRRFFEGDHDILVLGYSGSDEFDVNRVLKKCEKRNRIFWVRRPKKDKQSIVRLDEPFECFTGCIVHVGLKDLVSHLSSRLGGPLKLNGEKRDEWKTVVEEWGKDLPVGTKAYTAACVLFDIQLLEDAAKILEQCEESLKSSIRDIDLAFFTYLRGIIFQNHGDYEEAERLYGQSMAIREKLGDQRGIAALLHQLAMIHQNRGDYDEAERLYEQSMEKKDRLKDQSDISHTIHQLATMRYLKGDYDGAERLYRQSMRIEEKLGDQKGIAAGLQQLAMIHQIRGNYDEAERLYEQSMEIREKLGDQRGIAALLHQLAMIHQNRGDYDEAERLYRQSMRIEEKLGNQKGIAQSLHQLAMLHQIRGNYDEAERLYEQSMAIREKLGDPSGISYTIHQLANIRYLKDDYDEAERLYRQSMEIAERLKDQGGISVSLHQLAMIHQIRGNYDEAERLYEQSMEIKEKLKDLRGISYTIHQLAILRQDRDYYDEAEKLHKQSMAIFLRLGDQNGVAMTHLRLGYLFKVKCNNKRSREHFEEALKIFNKLDLKQYMDMTRKSISSLEEQTKKKNG